MENQPYIAIQHLSLSFKTDEGWKRVLENVSLNVAHGKTTALVGESGSGKSVTSLALMNLHKHGSTRIDQGELLVDGHRFDFNAPEIIAKRGKEWTMIFQEPMTSLNPVMTCGEQVAEVLKVHFNLHEKDAKGRVLELFEEVKLPEPTAMWSRYPHQLSGGQRQRVMIALAIACNPKLLIADEPTTALDVTVQRSILDLLLGLQKKYGMAMIFITHDLGVVQDLADDVVVMKHGKVVESGEATQILNDPKEDYTKGLLACRPVPGVKLERLLTVSDVLEGKERKPISENALFKSEGVLLDVNHLSKTYTKTIGFWKKRTIETKAVHEVSFQVFEGETLGLVGESGCGKTTLSRMLLGLIEASAGEIRYKGINLLELNSKEWRDMRRRVQIIFQDPYSSLNPRHTIKEIITSPILRFGLARSSSEANSIAENLLEKVGMPKDILSRYPHEFSGGQRQRIVIARALAVQPEFIICDESVAALDVSVQAQVLNLLNDLKKEFNLTLLFISHDLSVIYQMADRIMVMQKGKIEELGSATEVYHHPHSSYTQNLIASIPGGGR